MKGPRGGAGGLQGAGESRRQAALQVGAHRGPIVVDHAVEGGVAHTDARHQHVLAKDALELGGERGHRGARALVASVGLELHPHTSEVLEGVAEHQELRLDVRARPPGRRREPGPADLQAPVLLAQVQVARAADQLSAGAIDGREHTLTARLRIGEARAEPGGEVLAALRDRRQPLPDLRVLGSREQTLLVTGPQWLEHDQLPLEACRQFVPHRPGRLYRRIRGASSRDVSRRGPAEPAAQLASRRAPPRRPGEVLSRPRRPRSPARACRRWRRR